ncbi:MAG TPA: PDZ domain-containing protein [Thermoanaerobaculia bacterium]|nr:PDZ domain-containing protein [Thermoanaerobaculia bacterium]
MPSPRRPAVARSRFATAVLTAVLVAASFAAPPAAAAAEARPLLHHPTIHGDSVIFNQGGDLWRSPVAGGPAVRLTVDDGEESHPYFSPDGSLVAFRAEIDGDGDVYVMNADGGDVRRVTWHPGNDVPVGWHPVNGKILFASGRQGWPPVPRLYQVAADGSGLEALPLHEAAWGSFSPDGAQIAYNRGAREFRTWKRYRGGWAQEVYVYDFATATDRKLTDFTGTDRQPMWVGDAIYFGSDRDRRVNLHRLDSESGEVTQVTFHDDYDVQHPSTDGRRIVYELGGTLQVLDTAAGTGAEPRRIAVEMRIDDPEARPFVADVSGEVQSYAVSPSGARALVVARGEVFSVPREHGPTRDLSRTSGARERGAAWSPDGKWVAWLSDADGEYQIYRAEPGGGGEAEKLTTLAPGYRHTLRWSPDGSKIAFADHTLRLLVLDVESREVTEVDRAEHEPMDVSLDDKPIDDFQWSPDGRWLAYSKLDDDLVSGLWIWSADDGTVHAASEGLYNDFGPTWSGDGEHLLFVSNRRFDPTFGDLDWQMVYKRVAGIYALTLSRDGERLLPLRSDEEVVDEEEGEEAEAGDGEVRVEIDFEGLAGRVEALPVEPGNYRHLTAADGRLLFLDSDDGDYNRFEIRQLPPRRLESFSFDSREVETLAEAVEGYATSADGQHVVYSDGRNLSLQKLGGGEAAKLDLSGLRFQLDPRQEWRQIYREAWRMERDFYYDPAMHGLDWDEVGERYERLLPYASNRADVRFLVGEMIGELNTSHTYVFGGDERRQGERVGVGLLGADWTADAGRYRVEHVLTTSDWSREIYAPLAAPGVGVEAGDYLLAVDGEQVTADRNLHSYLVDKAGRQVTLTVADDASGGGSRDVRVVPLGGDFMLRYHDWVEGNRRHVEEASGGRIGYVHLPDTYMFSALEFPKLFYAQTRKEGLVVDGRFNGGGLDPDVFLERLARRPLNYWTRRYSHDYYNPLAATRAHMVMLANRQAGSGGDMLPAQFRQLGLGPIVGTRTWGGLVGVSMFLELIDGGGLTAPDYRIYDEGGRWIIEGHGVDPDVTVDLDPAEMERGYDRQLETGLEMLIEKLEAEPVEWPEHEAPPQDG